MTNKQLLALAAKAHGGLMYVPDTDRYYPDPRKFSDDHWNPLDDDGDAFRLMVKRALTLAMYRSLGVTYAYFNADINERVEWDGDENKATRLAIVRAAAKIGESME